VRSVEDAHDGRGWLDRRRDRRPSLWVAPLSFVTMMAAGGALGMTGFALPYVEIGIAISVLALGAMVVLQRIPACRGSGAGRAVRHLSRADGQ
jgi:hydrogenase/urease accessory protein HupE